MQRNHHGDSREPRRRHPSRAHRKERWRSKVTRFLDLEAGLSQERMKTQNSADATLPAIFSRAAAQHYAVATRSCALREQQATRARRAARPRKRQNRVLAYDDASPCVPARLESAGTRAGSGGKTGFALAKTRGLSRGESSSADLLAITAVSQAHHFPYELRIPTPHPSPTLFYGHPHLLLHIG